MSTLKTSNIQDTSGNNNSTPEEINRGRAKAWINFDGSAATIGTGRNHFNCGAVTDHDSGDYTVTFATDMPNTNYVPLLTPIARDNASGGTTQPGVRSSGGASLPNASLTVSGVRFVHRPTSTNVDADMFGLVVFGD
jgi:hypothetical protein